MSECYELGDGTFSVNYTKGDKFVFTGDFDYAYSGATEDELLGVYELVLDDGSSCPKFRSEVSGRSYYENWGFFSKCIPEQPIVETQPTEDLQSELTEALAKIDTLESALEDAVKEILSLKHRLIANAADTCLGIAQGESQFKPISEMTLEDWYEAKSEGWLFADNKFNEPNMVESIVNGEIYFDQFSSGFTVKGIHTEAPEEYQIIKRIK